MDFKNEIIPKHPVSNVSLAHYQHLCQDFAIWGGWAWIQRIMVIKMKEPQSELLYSWSLVQIHVPLIHGVTTDD